MAHCGTSDYAIYEMPSSQCSPPTARPGSSMHEQGLAVDFTCNGGGTVSSGDVCDGWLESNAATYGFYNLPSEPWHYSTNGN
jgi:LAS superfamily LD-carboxypeptidase LdcB